MIFFIIMRRMMNIVMLFNIRISFVLLAGKVHVPSTKRSGESAIKNYFPKRSW